jgi:hypothetical protein
MIPLLERYQDDIRGVISCFDRLIIHGSLPGFCYAAGMTSYLYRQGIRIFDYARFAEPLRDQIRENAQRIARENNLEIEYARKSSISKEACVAKVLRQRGDQPGLVHIISAMEACSSYKPWHDKHTGRTFLKPDSGKCLHYYFYFLDLDLGLCYIRVPTWCPFRLQIYFNGHNLLAYRLRQNGIAYRLLDNAFVDIADFAVAQTLADDLDVARIHFRLDEYARRCCPVIDQLEARYHWTLMQGEYATDVIFKKQSDLAAIYDHLTRTAIHTVKPDKVATFLGRKLTANFQDELGNRFSTRIEGTCIKHHMGPVSIKMYDKFGRVLRIETTVNDASFFKHYREVVQHDGATVIKYAQLRKTIYSLPALGALLLAANTRYLAFISEFDDPSQGRKILTQVTEPKTEHDRTYKGFNFFSAADQKLLEIIARGEFCINGMRNKDLRRYLRGMSPGRISRLLKRLRVHGFIKRVGHTYKYYLTRLGQRVIVAGLELKELFLAPRLALSCPK